MNTVQKTIHQMHTTHGNFNQREISDHDLDAILKASVRAATASNRQSYSIIVISEREKMHQLCGYRGSRALLFCVDTNRLNAQAATLGYNSIGSGTTAFITGCLDTVLAAQTAIICAQSLRIDTLPTNGIHRGDMRRVYDLLNLPEKYCFPMLMVVLGYADRHEATINGRLDGLGVIHYNQYQTLRQTDVTQIIQSYDDPQNHLCMTEDWNVKGYAHYLDWFHQVWMAGFKPPEPGVPTLHTMLASSGFLD